jgi:hypothetical protein
MLGFGLIVVSLLLTAIGCDSKAPTAMSSSTPSTSASSDQATADAPGMAAADEDKPTGAPTEGSPEGEANPGDVQDAFAQAMTSEIEANLASLSAEDHELAIKQKICPISEEPLGSMGAPIKVAVAGHEVFVCCEACEEPLKQDPTTHLAKIGLKPSTEDDVPK